MRPALASKVSSFVNMNRHGRRLAMSLFELMLVLVLLVVVGSLAAPLFEGSFSSLRLRSGTDQVLASWSQARTHAIEAGIIYQFRFKPAGNTYRLEPWSIDEDSDALLIDRAEIRTDVSNDEAEIETWTLEETLPEQIVFGSAESVSSDGLGERQVTRLDQDRMSHWSAPILFFPDGTTSSASLLLKNSKNVFQRATLRSLTGVGRASDLLSREEIDQLRSR